MVVLSTPPSPPPPPISVLAPTQNEVGGGSLFVVVQKKGRSCADWPPRRKVGPKAHAGHVANAQGLAPPLFGLGRAAVFVVHKGLSWLRLA